MTTTAATTALTAVDAKDGEGDGKMKKFLV